MCMFLYASLLLIFACLSMILPPCTPSGISGRSRGVIHTSGSPTYVGVLRAGITLREAEESFVDHEENLEEGEILLKAGQASLMYTCTHTYLNVLILTCTWAFVIVVVVCVYMRARLCARVCACLCSQELR